MSLVRIIDKPLETGVLFLFTKKTLSFSASALVFKP